MSDMAIQYERRPITVEEYHRMGEAGIFRPEERVELFEGELIAVPPMGHPHAGAVGAITRLLTMRFNDRAFVRVGLPIPIEPISEPEPDFAIVSLEPGEWRHRHPGPKDVMLLIEVANSSREFDLRRKAPVYARAVIPEYWVVDVVDKRLVVHRKPSAAGYALVQTLFPGETIAPIAFPDAPFDVAAFTGT